MEIIIFFTRPERLTDIGVIIPWDNSKHSIIKSQIDSTKQIWVVWDEIKFKDFLVELKNHEKISTVFFVYHSYPEHEFITNFISHLNEQKIFHKKDIKNQIPGSDTVYEKLESFPEFSEIDFEAIKEKIHPCSKYISSIMNKFIDPNIILNNEINLSDYPNEIQKIFTEKTLGITKETFDTKRQELKDALYQYCQSLTKNTKL